MGNREYGTRGGALAMTGVLLTLEKSLGMGQGSGGGLGRKDPGEGSSGRLGFFGWVVSNTGRKKKESPKSQGQKPKEGGTVTLEGCVGLRNTVVEIRWVQGKKNGLQGGKEKKTTPPHW